MNYLLFDVGVQAYVSEVSVDGKVSYAHLAYQAKVFTHLYSRTELPDSIKPYIEFYEGKKWRYEIRKFQYEVSLIN